MSQIDDVAPVDGVGWQELRASLKSLLWAMVQFAGSVVVLWAVCLGLAFEILAKVRHTGWEAQWPTAWWVAAVTAFVLVLGAFVMVARRQGVPPFGRR